MWVGVLITLLVGGFLFYVFATAHKHIEDSHNMNKLINNTNTNKELNKQDSVLAKLKSTIKNIFNTLKNKFKNTKINKQQKFEINYMKNTNLNKYINKDVTGLYLFEDIENSILYTYGMLIAISLPKVPSGWAIRILTGWWWIYCLLVAVAYKASMTAILANPDTRL
jgi:hypothetical protein